MLTDTALTVLTERYFVKDEDGNVIEDWDKLTKRVGYYMSHDQEEREAFREMIKDLYFLPNSPTLMNAGTGQGNLSACFVLPVEDSMDGIFTSIKNAALIHKFGGGTGFSFSKIRPKGSPVKSTKGVASGVLSFMSVFDAATEVVKQGGKRRGANMGILNIHHPDIEEFITVKEDQNKLNNFNLSVAITDEFMRAVNEGTDYNLYSPQDGSVVKTLNAKTIWNIIIRKAWEGGDPGVIFIDTINDANATPHLGTLEATNPCGEIILYPYESCNLGSLNLGKYVDLNSTKIDYELLEKHIRLAVRFLDNVIDNNIYPIPEIEQVTKKTRKIGLGIMGLHDALIKLGIAYDSDEGIEAAAKLMKYVETVAVNESEILSNEKGVFQAYINSLPYPPRRNATLTSIQPTGTVSMIADCSSGCEPIFSIIVTKKVMDQEFVMVSPLFIEVAKKHGFYSEELMDKIKESGSVQNIEEVPEEIRRLFKTAQEIAPEKHVKMQAALQMSVHNSISKTINMPNEASEEDIAEMYKLAYESKCKGITIYRDGSRSVQVLYTGEDKEETAVVSSAGLVKKSLPDELNARRYKLKDTNDDSIYIIVCFDEDETPVEVFAKFPFDNRIELKDKSTMWTTTCRLVSILLRYGVCMEEIVNQLDKSSGSMRDLPGQLSKLLKSFMSSTKNGYSPECPDCGSATVYKEGCQSCEVCGWSHCS